MSTVPVGLPGEVRRALIEGANRAAEAGYGVAASLAEIRQSGIDRATELGQLDRDTLQTISTWAIRLAHSVADLAALNEALATGADYAAVAPILPGVVPGLTVNTTVEADIGSGRGVERVYVRLTNLPDASADTIRAAVDRALEEYASAYGPGTAYYFESGTISVREFYQG